MCSPFCQFCNKVEWAWCHRNANNKGLSPQRFLANSVPATKTPDDLAGHFFYLQVIGIQLRHRLRSHNKAHPKGRKFINESLTKINRRRFNLCLQFKKKKNIKFIWTKHGVTYLRDSEGAKAMAIKTEDDLVKYDSGRFTCATSDNCSKWNQN